MSETTYSRVVTRCYIREDGAFILRTRGEDTVVPAPTLSEAALKSLAANEIARLLLAGASVADIESGKAIPARAIPAERGAKVAGPRALTMLQRAVVFVRMVEMVKDAKARGEKPNKEAIAADAETWVRALSKEDLAKLGKTQAVSVELAKLRAPAITLEQAMAGTGRAEGEAEAE